MGDYLAQLPSVPFEKIFRKLGYSDQKSVYKAYINTEEEHVLDQVRRFKQPITCWICMSEHFMQKSWATKLDGGDQRDLSNDTTACKEPAFDTEGFDLTFKLQKRDFFNSQRREIYVPRNLLHDHGKADEILSELCEDFRNCFTTNDYDELHDHITQTHGTLDPENPNSAGLAHGYFPKEFLRSLEAKKGKS